MDAEVWSKQNVNTVMWLIFLTCLFQIYDEKKKPEVLVDGWNVYFFHDLKTLVRLSQPSSKHYSGIKLKCYSVKSWLGPRSEHS